MKKLRRGHRWSAAWITFELPQAGTSISRRTVSRHLAEIGESRGASTLDAPATWCQVRSSMNGWVPRRMSGVATDPASRYVGHLVITREFIDGQTGE
jgi:hypothetical protein